MVTVVWFVLTMIAAVLFLLVCSLLIGGVLGPVAAAALAPTPAEGWAESRYETPSGARPGVNKVVVVERVPCAPRSAAPTSRAARALRRETDAAKERGRERPKESIRHDKRPPEVLIVNGPVTGGKA